MALVLYLEEASAHRHGNSHDDRFTDPSDVVHPAMQGCIKQMVCGLHTGGQHVEPVLHLGNAKKTNIQHLTLSTAEAPV